ncbi:MraY family glycosyltransferase [Sideroxydans lithotrophicus]|uniref:Glycosyl transferase, family 4, conserved region n=1 Tax=Sideroxydans lithotrophicus (strain ES-1) TaxID=580332 RepID=D5CQ85_SIDLE|nr:glycosyltransferase family 4 protein [Sideroxydans lithotrophicus]ADE13106.1 Glycosyl transferase, family 4, conserved region [Sideroxydans lithotrophicus ES-1]
MSHYSPIVAALVTMLLTTLILISKFGKVIEDIPNERSLHDAPVPRIGGVAMMAGLLAGWALVLTSLMWWIVVPLIGLFVVSLMDDMHNLPVKQRLLAHLTAAAILVFGSGLFAQHGVIVALIILLFTVWMTNLYNFMDGSDGLAGGMALFGFSMYGFAALMSHDDTQAMLNFTIGAAALGFLYNNFHPAKVFMGDAGSIPLGFLAAGMGLWGWQQGHWAAWFPLLVFSPFIVDASVTLVKRKLRGARVTEAHREHYYQRLVQMGWSHRKVALTEYALMLGVGISALYALQDEFPWLVFSVWGGIYAALMLLLDAAWRRFERSQHAQG